MIVIYLIISSILIAIACYPVSLALRWAARKISARGWIYGGLLILAGLFIPSANLAADPQYLGTLEATLLILIALAAIVIAAVLFFSGINLYQKQQNAGAVEGAGSPTMRKNAGRTAALALVLSALLPAKILYNLYWFTVWDNTVDSLGYIWLMIPILVTLFTGILLTINLPGRMKAAGILYALLFLALMIAVSARAQRIDFRQLTEKRAERASQAIEDYYAYNGHYPQNLRQVIPWYALSLPGPVILYGQDWCYEGGDNYYRLGYVDRKHWSYPLLNGHIYKTQGEAPDNRPICDAEIAALQKRFPYFKNMNNE